MNAIIQNPKTIKLTDNEQQLVRLFAYGHGNEFIALTLFITVDTVKTRAIRLYNKTGIHNRAGLVGYCMAYGLIDVAVVKRGYDRVFTPPPKEGQQ